MHRTSFSQRPPIRVRLKADILCAAHFLILRRPCHHDHLAPPWHRRARAKSIVNRRQNLAASFFNGVGDRAADTEATTASSMY